MCAIGKCIVEFVPSLIGLAGIHILMAMLPGPNIVVVSWFSATQSRGESLRVVVGVVLASVAWVVQFRALCNRAVERGSVSPRPAEYRAGLPFASTPAFNSVRADISGRVSNSTMRQRLPPPQHLLPIVSSPPLDFQLQDGPVV